MLNEVEMMVKNFLNGKRIDETKNFKPTRVWSRGKYGNPIIVLLHFRTFPENKAEFKIYVDAGESIGQSRMVYRSGRYRLTEHRSDVS